jgi:glucosamine--fructose-6-phosphate aminotransferase (isomerizing)
MPTVAVAPRDDIYEKMISNIQEIKSRRGPVIGVVSEADEKMKEVVDEVIEIPVTLDFLNPLLAVVPCQLLAYYCASFLNRDIDKPRNLAKSVTVE